MALVRTVGRQGGVYDLLHVWAPIALKRLLFSRRGEAYEISGHTLRFLPGTRPVRLKYATAIDNPVTRYDALQLQFLVEHVKPGFHCADVGAHHGQDTLVMAALCGPAGHVTAFEPDPLARAVWERNVLLNPKLRRPSLVAAAVSDADGVAVFFGGASTANSSLAASASEAHPAIYRVETVTLDSHFAVPPNVVKIDVEGHEIRVLSAAQRLLASDATILVELHPYVWPELGDSFDGLTALLARHGRWPRYLDEDQEAREPRYGIIVAEAPRGVSRYRARQKAGRSET